MEHLFSFFYLFLALIASTVVSVLGYNFEDDT